MNECLVYHPSDINYIERERLGMTEERSLPVLFVECHVFLPSSSFFFLVMPAAQVVGRALSTPKIYISSIRRRTEKKCCSRSSKTCARPPARPPACPPGCPSPSLSVSLSLFDSSHSLSVSCVKREREREKILKNNRQGEMNNYRCMFGLFLSRRSSSSSSSISSLLKRTTRRRKEEEEVCVHVTLSPSLPRLPGERLLLTRDQSIDDNTSCCFLRRLLTLNQQEKKKNTIQSCFVSVHFAKNCLYKYLDTNDVHTFTHTHTK